MIVVSDINFEELEGYDEWLDDIDKQNLFWDNYRHMEEITNDREE